MEKSHDFHARKATCRSRNSTKELVQALCATRPRHLPCSGASSSPKRIGSSYASICRRGASTLEPSGWSESGRNRWISMAFAGKRGVSGGMRSTQIRSFFFPVVVPEATEILRDTFQLEYRIAWNPEAQKQIEKFGEWHGADHSHRIQQKQSFGQYTYTRR